MDNRHLRGGDTVVEPRHLPKHSKMVYHRAGSIVALEAEDTWNNEDWAETAPKFRH